MVSHAPQTRTNKQAPVLPNSCRKLQLENLIYRQGASIINTPEEQQSRIYLGNQPQK